MYKFEGVNFEVVQAQDKNKYDYWGLWKSLSSLPVIATGDCITLTSIQEGAIECVEIKKDFD